MSTTRDHVVTAYRDEHGTWKARCRCGIRWEGERTRTLTVAACRQSCHVGQVEALERAIPWQVASYARGADPWGLTYARVNLRELAELDPRVPSLEYLRDLVAAAGELAALAAGRVEVAL